MPSKRLNVAQRREVFESLVAVQDEGTMSVAESIQHVSKEFGITEHQVRQIEEEGIEKEWPPLEEAASLN